jgi:U32 family peptidase
MKKVELLAPAGSLSKMKYAVEFGADAVYLGVPDFSLRARVNNFSEKDFEEAIRFAHTRDKKVYVTLNIYAHNSHLKAIERHLSFLGSLGEGEKVDAIIVSDPGIISLVKKHLPEVDIHLSTQANATNFEAVKFWKSVGVKRIILAREVNIEEIREIHRQVPDVELEVFVHGAMCMSYSGRCILSKWMNGRSANLGDCSQPCRWAFSLVDDQKRFGMDVEEDENGTYFFNSFDLNLISHIEKLIEAGVSSLKIEGRAKSAYYVAVATRAYRKVIDVIANSSDRDEIEKVISEQKNELDKLTNRGYWTGFLLGDEPPHNFSGKLRKSQFEFVGEVENTSKETSWELNSHVPREFNSLRIHNAVRVEDEIEAVMPEKNIKVKILKIFNDEKIEVREAHGGHEKRYFFRFSEVLPAGSLIRRKVF